ncbi:hypothetical protein P691DRAFT_264173 [Macrolepiota fuliginosa MF-IS2]|uniref:Uncharacterized protein n=1 Tax=Macrolepiota fuliginosa MF-IS2 TaxID=1400762 RepID=A0A9P5XA33_9AGAR|nr:hypothetical protein P691DRAFT_264173 [Macrolepiota fuliginosa MF-IS2]
MNRETHPLLRSLNQDLPGFFANSNRSPSWLDLMRVLDLKCESKLLWDIKNLIRKATDELFDINRTAKEQDYIAIAELRGRLTQRFPDIFEDPSLRVAVRHKRMQAAMDYVSRSYTWKRVKHRTDMKEEEERNDDRDSLQIRRKGPSPTRPNKPADPSYILQGHSKGPSAAPRTNRD